MKDLILNSEGELDIKDGDLVVGTSDDQHKQHLLMFQKGALKENPATGVGLATYLESEDTTGLLREIRNQFEGDGMTVEKVGIDVNALLSIRAEYK